MTRKYPLPEITDPRDIIPDLKPLMNDDDVAAWQAEPQCLCRCGTRTTVERQNERRTPINTYRLFTSNHEQRMPWMAEHTAAREAARLAARTHQNEVERCVSSGPLAQMVREWQEANYKGLVHLAYLTGISARTIRRLVATDVFVRKDIAARVMIAIGKTELTPDLAKAYEAWCRGADVPAKAFTVVAD